MDLAKHIRPLTGQRDWPLWKRKIRDLLDYHEGALDVIDKRLEKPVLDDCASEAQRKVHKAKSELYRKANSYAKSMIASSVTDEVYLKIMDKETAYEAWEALKQQFEATSKDQLFKICTDFFAFTWNASEDVSTHIAKLKGLWNDVNAGLKSKGENEMPDLILMCKTLHILPSTFETFKSSWMLLTKDEVKTFDELTMQLCMFERNFQKNTEDEKSAQEALTVKPDKYKKENKFKYNSKIIARKEDICNYCKKKGHWVKSCRKWITDGRPSKEIAHRNTINSVSAMNLVCSEAYATESLSTDWWIDNGATRHITNSSDYFTEFQTFRSPSSVKVAGKEILTAVGKGTIRIISKVNGKILQLDLKDVWYVPKISKNLFSVVAAHDKNEGSQFHSTATKCWFKIKNEIVLCGSRVIGGTLYKADIMATLPDEQNVNLVMADSSVLQLYHERWGHQDKRHVSEMLEKELDIKVSLNTELCEPCIYGKAHRLPFGTRKKTSKPGELMSGDVCGPFNFSFKKGRYLVVFKDSYTKYRYGFIIKEKTEVIEALKTMITHAKNQGHTIKEFLSDNGKEFDNVGVRRILQENGITQRLTAPYTPEQNGGSERENRTIVEMARTFKYSNPEIQFPEAIWAELVSTAIYILNRTGKSSVKGCSPYELWIGERPRLKHLRIIGSTCFTHIPIQKRKKMDMKAVKGYLVGYDGDERYRVYVPEGHNIVLSRDIKFHEKFSECAEQVKLPLQDNCLENDRSKYEQEEDQTQKNQQDQKDKEENNESEESPTDQIEDIEQKSVMGRLSDRSTLKKPITYNECTMIAEVLLNEAFEPETVEDALNSTDRVQWSQAMEDEMASLKKNQTWELSTLPQGAKALPCKWVFRLKKNPDGSIDRYKARLVVKGYSQRLGVDYNQTYSPVAKMGTIRTILSVVASEGMEMAQFDVSTAFLYGELEEEIYMNQPEGYSDKSEKVCRLKRSLYGLKQAPRCWNKRFGGFLKSLGFNVSEADPCLFVKDNNNREKVFIALYVDDGLVAARQKKDLEWLLTELQKEFKITWKKAEYFLGLQIQQDENCIKISQKALAIKILEKFNFSGCKPVSTPILKDHLALESGKEEMTIRKGKEQDKQDFPYRQAVGALMYLMIGSRPDLAYTVGFLSRSLENPKSEDITRVKRAFRYIAGSPDLGINYSTKSGGGTLECFSDADFGGCQKTGRSTTGVVISHAGGAISWISQRQPTVATSTTEAEIVAASEATKEILWLVKLFKEIRPLACPPILQVDNSAAVRLAENPEFHKRTKHIAIKHFFVREKISEKMMGILQVSTEKQVADLMTKPLQKTRLKMLCEKMGLS